MRLIYAGIVLTCASLGFADTITLKNGKVLNGSYLGGNPRQVRFEVNGDLQTLDVDEITRIEFSEPAPRMPAPPPPRESNVMRPPDPPPPMQQQQRAAMAGFTLPEGTLLTIRMIDAVDSEQSRVGQTFAASLDEPVMLNGEQAIPRGADVVVKLVDSKQSGKLAGRTELALSLQSIRVNGQMVDVNTQTVTQASSSRGNRTAKVAGGTAALGAIIGGIAGGGKGAAIGAGAGAATGAGVEMATAGQRVRVPSETRLTFRLDNAVRF